MEAEWHLNKTVAMRTVIMGCEIELVVENRTASVSLGESILAFLESFLSTAIRLKGHHSARPYLRMEIRQSEYAGSPFSYHVEEDECGESCIIVMHPKAPVSLLVQGSAYQEALFRLLAELIPQLQVPFSSESIEGLFARDRAQDRAFLAAQSPLALTNVLGETPKYHVRDWTDVSLIESLPPLRTKQWEATPEPIVSEGETPPFTFVEGPPPG